MNKNYRDLIDLSWERPESILHIFNTLRFVTSFANISILKLNFRKTHTQMHAGLLFDHYFDFLSVETDINISGLNLESNLEESEAIKRDIPATWLTICLNHFEFDVTWKVFQLLIMLNFQFLPLGIVFKTKNRKSQKIFIFWIYKAQMNGGLFFDHYFNFLSVKTDTQKSRAQFD